MMPPIARPLVYRQATPDDIPGMAEVRAGDWGSEPYWRERIARYLSGELTPRQGVPDTRRASDRLHEGAAPEPALSLSKGSRPSVGR